VLQLEADGFDGNVYALVDFLQYKAHDSPAARLEPAVAATVVCLLVRITVDLNNQLRSATCEVNDVGPDRVLSPEFDAEPAGSQMPPHSGFDAGHVGAQVLSALYHRIFDDLSSFRPQGHDEKSRC